jgi:hypothetical protein
MVWQCSTGQERHEVRPSPEGNVRLSRVEGEVVFSFLGVGRVGKSAFLLLIFREQKRLFTLYLLRLMLSVFFLPLALLCCCCARLREKWRQRAKKRGNERAAVGHNRRTKLAPPKRRRMRKCT